MNGTNNYKKMQAVAMLAQELHISLPEAEIELAKRIVYSDQVRQSQIEASRLVDEMMD
jgi:hypothetical protein